MALTKKKRGADNYLTDQNWDAEEEADEEAGSFKVADENVLEKRTFKKAHRRKVITGADDTGSNEESKTKLNPFTAFSGFGTLTGLANNSKVDNKTFSTTSIFTGTFGGVKDTSLKTEKKLDSEAPTENIGFWSKNNTASNDFFANRGKIETKECSNSTEKDLVNTKTETVDSEINNNNDTYFQHLCALNVSVLSWIKQHVNSNPCIDLTPVFNDYSKYLKELDEKRGDFKSIQNTAIKSILKTPESCHVSSSLMAASKQNIISSTPIQKENAPVTKFSSNFFSSTPYPAKPIETAVINKDDEDDEGEVIPEPEIKTIVEENAFYQIRCKLFFKKSNQWQELGKGMLYLKKSSDDAKTQLLIRMEIATGKILLNVSLNSGMPISRTGKNNVMIVSIPNPPVYTKASDGDNSVPCTYLIRVKGTPEADELLSKMKE
ncbi:nuclear pore complex protein Nup50 isoform X1 [Hydra vulgaris]|uniref:Nuclear pore complex protein Nup50 n=1 Tax=Hydra vulgaris TaxID=6087 RepID=T2M3V0_HYDVU|nr:nuclear pore complex protein Nup50 [Hydra vulgaris]